MAGAKTHEIVAHAVNATGPGGTRCRAGLKFWPRGDDNAPESYKVDEAQLKMIKGDPVINVASVKAIKAAEKKGK